MQLSIFRKVLAGWILVQTAQGVMNSTGSASKKAKSSKSSKRSKPKGLSKIDLMTQNQYLGADLLIISVAAASGDPAVLNNGLIDFFASVSATDFMARVKKLAKIIAHRLPDAVGLQEVFKYTCTGNPCENELVKNAFNDHLELTLQALEDLGCLYEPIVIYEGTSVPFEFTFDGKDNAVANISDRHVILVRNDISATPVDFACPIPSGDGCTYSTSLPTPVGNYIRGFAGVDLTIEDAKYRIIHTHLEAYYPDPTNPLSSAIQALQAQELIKTISASTPLDHSVILIGDINSGTHAEIIEEPFLIVPPYIQFINAGYIDVWPASKGASTKSGFTCCEDEDLLNPDSKLDIRIDMIFSVDAPFKASRAKVLGTKESDKTKTGLWPSDHVTFAAELHFDISGED
eukprot:CAMPEP_0172486848 /NCGR_PEP_ID=MMETSP1066-20121228/15600_1 /TAXON_ID=671091 /ORGANISM="Coscinodiscus wailesii, Strain CCMP2513" /LENGTH=402 /DNA_ID=CAMNT_0013253061 /DNA_START=21 /DNA_END=1229 /DNA_ORIENTATION=-